MRPSAHLVLVTGSTNDPDGRGDPTIGVRLTGHAVDCRPSVGWAHRRSRNHRGRTPLVVGYIAYWVVKDRDGAPDPVDALVRAEG